MSISLSLFLFLEECSLVHFSHSPSLNGLKGTYSWIEPDKSRKEIDPDVSLCISVGHISNRYDLLIATACRSLKLRPSDLLSEFY